MGIKKYFQNQLSLKFNYISQGAKKTNYKKKQTKNQRPRILNLHI